MATGFSVMDALNKNSKAGIDESPKARFRTKDISIFKMYRNDMNFYKVADIEELAGDILMHGLKQNLELVYEPCGGGEYRIVSGERRWEALKLLVTKGYKEFEIATCKLTSPQDADEEQVEIISANAYRTKSIADTIEEEQRLKASLERMRAAGKQVKGYDLNSGRLRDVIASMLRMSKTKVAQIESVSNNLIPEFKEELNKERLTFSAAYELSGMTGEEQREALAAYGETGELTHKDVKTMKGGKAAGQQDSKEPGHVSESDTGQQDTGKTGVNPPEAYRTEEQRYSAEQDRIGKETAGKLREQAGREKMNGIPSGTVDDSRKVHKIKLGKSFFGDVYSGEKTFELRKNDRGYKKGDILELMEFADGRDTGRIVRALVTYILEDFTGLEDGYCIMGIKIMAICGIDMAKDRRQRDNENDES